MPNIEIHGLSGEEGDKLSREIFELFKYEPYVDEMVVTIFQDRVVDRKGSSQPFIRLANFCQDHTPAIIAALERLDIDIEHLELKAFIPKRPGG